MGGTLTAAALTLVLACGMARATLRWWWLHSALVIVAAAVAGVAGPSARALRQLWTKVRKSNDQA